MYIAYDPLRGTTPALRATPPREGNGGYAGIFVALHSPPVELNLTHKIIGLFHLAATRNYPPAHGQGHTPAPLTSAMSAT